MVANPGCYPTSVQLPLVPLIEAGLILTEDIIIDAKSGELKSVGPIDDRCALLHAACVTALVLVLCVRCACAIAACALNANSTVASSLRSCGALGGTASTAF